MTGPDRSAAGIDFDTDAFRRFLDGHFADPQAEFSLERISGGQSNPTYFVSHGDRRMVLRKKPAGKILPGAHAIEREYRVLAALYPTEVPVPRPILLHEDAGLIGTPFYLMARVEGRVFADCALPELPPAERPGIYMAMADALAKLHRARPEEIGLSDYGRPGNYFERQIARWTRQWRESDSPPIAALDALADWLPANLPADDGATAIAHGDFRLGNLLFHPSEPRVVAILDWELSTLGHPLADFSYHCMSWHIKPGAFRGLGGLDVESLGIPTESEYIRKYCERTGITTPEALAPDWNFYQAYNLFRIAAILQGIAKRVEAGTASSDQAVASGRGARPMAELAWQFAERA